MGVGLIDDVCAPTAVYSVFNALPSRQKTMMVAPNRGHEFPPAWLETMQTFFARSKK